MFSIQVSEAKENTRTLLKDVNINRERERAVELYEAPATCLNQFYITLPHPRFPAKSSHPREDRSTSIMHCLHFVVGNNI